MNPRSLITMFLGFAEQLKFRMLFLFVTALLILDLLIPDFVPLIDEIILGLLAIILANWKKERKDGRLIEGEVIDNDEGPEDKQQ